MMNAKLALTSEDVVRLYPELATCVGTLANWRSQRRGPKYYKISGRVAQSGGRVIYKPEDIEAFLFKNPVIPIND